MSKRNEYDAIWGSDCPPDDGEELDGIGLSNQDALYSEVFDEEGGEVICPYCGGEIVWRESDGAYICQECETEFSRVEFFKYIGADPPGPQCLTCGNLYPGCVICPYNYV